MSDRLPPARVRCVLDIARWLLRCGAPRCAQHVLRVASIHSREANDIREEAHVSSVASRIFGLAVDEESLLGPMVIPIELSSHGIPGDAAVGELVRQVFGDFDPLPPIGRVPSDPLHTYGDSLGLALAVGAVGYYARLNPKKPVFVTGKVTSDGRVVGVEYVAEKLTAATRELEGTDGIILVPRQHGTSLPSMAIAVGTLAEALECAFGRTRFEPDASLLDLDRAIDALDRPIADDHLDSARRLLALDSPERPPADRARIALAAARQLRHAGRSGEARDLERRGLETLRRARHVVGAEAIEYWTVESLMTALDATFELGLLEAELQEWLGRGFQQLHNEVRCRGMLAMVQSMAGKPATALRLRQESLALQRHSAALKAELPRTLCYLALDAARAGEGSAFSAFADELCRRTTTDTQWRYTASSVTRGLVLLGRDQEALDWIDGTPFVGHLPPRPLIEFLSADDPVKQHPEVSTLRAILRALRRRGRTEDALRQAGRLGIDRARPHVADLHQWIRGVACLEAALAASSTFIAARVAQIRERMLEHHPAASRAHPALFTSSLDELPDAIDGVWY